MNSKFLLQWVFQIQILKARLGRSFYQSGVFSVWIVWVGLASGLLAPITAEADDPRSVGCIPALLREASIDLPKHPNPAELQRAVTHLLQTADFDRLKDPHSEMPLAKRTLIEGMEWLRTYEVITQILRSFTIGMDPKVGRLEWNSYSQLMRKALDPRWGSQVVSSAISAIYALYMSSNYYHRRFEFRYRFVTETSPPVPPTTWSSSSGEPPTLEAKIDFLIEELVRPTLLHPEVHPLITLFFLQKDPGLFGVVENRNNGRADFFRRSFNWVVGGRQPVVAINWRLQPYGTRNADEGSIPSMPRFDPPVTTFIGGQVEDFRFTESDEFRAAFLQRLRKDLNFRSGQEGFATSDAGDFLQKVSGKSAFYQGYENIPGIIFGPLPASVARVLTLTILEFSHRTYNSFIGGFGSRRTVFLRMTTNGDQFAANDLFSLDSLRSLLHPSSSPQ